MHVRPVRPRKGFGQKGKKIKEEERLKKKKRRKKDEEVRLAVGRESLSGPRASEKRAAEPARLPRFASSKGGSKEAGGRRPEARGQGDGEYDLVRPQISVVEKSIPIPGERRSSRPRANRITRTALLIRRCIVGRSLGRDLVGDG